MFFYATACALFAGIFIVRYHLELILFAPFAAGVFAYYLQHRHAAGQPGAEPREALPAARLLRLHGRCAPLLFVLLMFTSDSALYELFNVEPSHDRPAVDDRELPQVTANAAHNLRPPARGVRDGFRLLRGVQRPPVLPVGRPFPARILGVGRPLHSLNLSMIAGIMTVIAALLGRDSFGFDLRTASCSRLASRISCPRRSLRISRRLAAVHRFLKSLVIVYLILTLVTDTDQLRACSWPLPSRWASKAPSRDGRG